MPGMIITFVINTEMSNLSGYAGMIITYVINTEMSDLSCYAGMIITFVINKKTIPNAARLTEWCIDPASAELLPGWLCRSWSSCSRGTRRHMLASVCTYRWRTAAWLCCPPERTSQHPPWWSLQALTTQRHSLLIISPSIISFALGSRTIISTAIHSRAIVSK